MDLSYVKKIIKLLSESAVDEIEIEEEGKKVRVVKHAGNSVGTVSTPVPMYHPFPPFPVAAAPPAPVPAPGSTATVAPPAAEPQKKLHEIKSPIVGTFYKAPAPDASPFVELGTLIQPGTVLCIVEAMKLMNEIESDIAGKIAQVMVQNGQPVEYGQTLFLVEPS